jgi:hypothetical protein
MKIQEEILNATTDTNNNLKVLNRNIESLVQAVAKSQETPEKPQKIGFVQNAVKSIIDNPKTSFAGVSSMVLGVVSKLYPQYAEIINSCMVGITGGGLIIARDAKPATQPVAPVQPNEELLG